MRVCLRFFWLSYFEILSKLVKHTYGEFATWETSHLIEILKKKKTKKQKNTAPNVYTNPSFSVIIDWKFVYPFW
jgi:hypothetical protein